MFFLSKGVFEYFPLGVRKAQTFFQERICLIPPVKRSRKPSIRKLFHLGIFELILLKLIELRVDYNLCLKLQHHSSIRFTIKKNDDLCSRTSVVGTFPNLGLPELNFTKTIIVVKMFPDPPEVGGKENSLNN